MAFYDCVRTLIAYNSNETNIIQTCLGDIGREKDVANVG